MNIASNNVLEMQQICVWCSFPYAVLLTHKIIQYVDKCVADIMLTRSLYGFTYYFGSEVECYLLT